MSVNGIVTIGRFNKIEASTYAECERVYLSEQHEDGLYSACIKDGVLYIMERTDNGDYLIKSVYKVFSLEVER